MTRKSRTAIIAVLLLLALALYFISGTYARYASEFTGTGTVNVAKWAVQVAGSEEEEFELTLTPEDDENIVEGRIAPSYTATGTIEVDLTGTEVAVDLKAEIGDLSDTILADNEKVSVTATIEQQGSAAAATGDLTGDKGCTIALPSDGQAFKAENGKYNIKVSVTWLNDNSPEQDPTDTATGKEGGEVTIPVKLQLTQHIKEA